MKMQSLLCSDLRKMFMLFSLIYVLLSVDIVILVGMVLIKKNLMD